MFQKGNRVLGFIEIVKGLGANKFCAKVLGETFFFGTTFCIWGRVLGWAGLGWAGLGWAGWAGLGWAGLGWAGLGWAGLGWAGLGWAGLVCLHRKKELPDSQQQQAISVYVFLEGLGFRVLVFRV